MTAVSAETSFSYFYIDISILNLSIYKKYFLPSSRHNTVLVGESCRHACRHAAVTGKENGLTTFASICTGGGGTDLGAKAAGLELAWGLELNPLITEVANHNLGSHVMTGDLLQSNPRRFDPVDVLHASPPCPNFSAAKIGSAETALDIALAEKVAEFVTVLQPRVFTLENVPMYRKSKSWALIQRALYRDGYWLHVAILNAADFGVPQTRRRLVVRAVKEGFVPHLPAKQPWCGWYDAIADLIPDLPESQFAPWQLARLPREVATMLVSGGGCHFENEIRQIAHFGAGEPAHTVTLSSSKSRAFIVHPTDFRSMPVREADDPMFTCVAGSGHALNMPRAYLVDQGNAHGTTREPTVRASEAPSFTITGSQNRTRHRALFESGRIVKMTPRALARFQSFPDSYELPDSVTLACRVVGNACSPKMFEQIYRGVA